MTYASPEHLLAPAEESEDFELPSGHTVKVRGLTRYELMLFTKDQPDNGVYEIRVIAACLLEPKMSQGQVEAWSRVDQAAGDMAALSAHLRALSGLSEGAGKSGVAEVRD